MSSNAMASLLSKSWPVHRGNDFRTDQKVQAEMAMRRTICGVCGKRSRLLDGPAGRQWFKEHECRRSA